MGRIIAFTGGKGGTGKSTVAVNVAALLCKDRTAVLADLDVECPNDHLLLSSKLGNSSDVMLFNPTFVETRCNSCGKCMEACQDHAIVIPPGKRPFLLTQLCSGCRACEIVCPEDAVVPGGRSIGKVHRTKVKFSGAEMDLVTGMLRESEERTYPLMIATRREALAIRAEVHVIDTAAGTTNSVAASLLKAEVLFAVCEPTLPGIHDLAMIMELGERIGIRERYIVINRSDIGSKEMDMKIRTISERFASPVIARIPNSKAILDSNLSGMPYVLTGKDPDLMKAFEDIAGAI